MKDELIILRLKKSVKHDIFLGEASMAGTENLMSELTVDIDDFNVKNISSLANRNDILAFAPAMPMKLVEPIGVNNVDVSGVGGTTWGIRAVGADQTAFTGKGIVVAVLDTGIDALHSAFNGVELIQKDFTGTGNNDSNGHGTHCAGTIFGRDVNNTRIGVATGVTKALIGKVLSNNTGSSASIINAISWASQNGAHVISMSLGIDFPGFVESLVARGIEPALATSRALESYRANVQLFEKMAQFVRVNSSFFQSTILIAAAGNESRKNVNEQFEIGVSPPAVSDGFISVAALGEEPEGRFKIAPFSNVGAMISGPGVNVFSAKLGGGLVGMSGTSMATPHVAGIAALWAEKLVNSGSLNPMLLTAKILASGLNNNMISGFDPFDTGAGMVQAPKQ